MKDFMNDEPKNGLYYLLRDIKPKPWYRRIDPRSIYVKIIIWVFCFFIGWFIGDLTR